MILVIIPGAYATRESWPRFEKEMPRRIERIFLQYNPADPIEKIIPAFAKQINTLNDDAIIIGHSLGGIIALRLSDLCPRVKSVVTVSAPFGGCVISEYMAFASVFMAPTNKFWDNIRPGNQTLATLRKNDVKIDTTIFISEEKYTNAFAIPSDGIVTVTSQTALGKKSNVIYEKIFSDHITAFQHQAVIACVKELLS